MRLAKNTLRTEVSEALVRYIESLPQEGREAISFALIELYESETGEAWRFCISPVTESVFIWEDVEYDNYPIRYIEPTLFAACASEVVISA